MPRVPLTIADTAPMSNDTMGRYTLPTVQCPGKAPVLLSGSSPTRRVSPERPPARQSALSRALYSLLSVATNGSPAFALRSWSLISPRLEPAGDAFDHREDELNVDDRRFGLSREVLGLARCASQRVTAQSP